MSIIDNVFQCWGCPIFDSMFQVVSAAGAAVYDKMAIWAWVVLIAFWAFYALWVVYLTMKDKETKEWLYQESVKPAFINSLVICVLLGMGAALPKLVASITFEPVADVAAVYAESVLQINAETVEQKVPYVSKPMKDNGIFRVELRDKIIRLMKTTTTQFQSMMKLGFSVMHKAFSLDAIISVNPIASLIKHFLMFFLGAYMTYQFFSLFIRFCFYFVDVVVALALFAFFFPFMLVFFVFKNSSATGWVKKIGDAFAPSLIQNAINAVVALVVAVITYTIVMVIIAKFFASDAMSSNEIVRHILAGTVSKDILDNENLVNMTLLGCIVIGFVVNYLVEQIPSVTKEIFKAFGVSPESKLGEQIGADVEETIKDLGKLVADKAKIVATGKADDKKDDKKTDDKKDDKKTEDDKKE